MAEIEVKLDDHSEEVMNALDNAIIRALEVCALKMKEYAQNEVPTDTTWLQQNIESEVDEEEKTAYIGVKVMKPAPYGIYVEFGTGVYAEEGNGRKTPWVYQDKSGNWHQTKGMEGHPFIRPSITEHQEEYINIIADSINNM